MEHTQTPSSQHKGDLLPWRDKQGERRLGSDKGNSRCVCRNRFFFFNEERGSLCLIGRLSWCKRIEDVDSWTLVFSLRHESVAK